MSAPKLGPLEVQDRCERLVIFKGDQEIASIDADTFEGNQGEAEAYANAFTAAPDLLEACRLAQVWLGTPGELASERFERLAEEFLADTGFSAPGKDVAAAMSMDDYAARDDAWGEWKVRKQEALLGALAAATAKAGAP